MNVWVFLRSIGALPVLVLSSAEIVALTDADVAMLRDDLGATDTLIAALRARAAAAPAGAWTVDPEAGTITAYSE